MKENELAKDPSFYGLDINKIYQSNNYGPYKVLNVFKDSTVYAKATIQFLITGYIRSSYISNVKHGFVNDESLGYKIPLDTNNLSEEDKADRIYNILRNMWREMKKRCLNPNADNYYRYGGNGIKISEDWLDFNVFENDAKSLFQYDKFVINPTIYQLDKDYLQLEIPSNERIYSKDTCVFLHMKDNINIRSYEYKLQHQDLLGSKYYGVSKSGDGTYNCHMICNNANIYFGTFDNEEIAAAVYNYWYKIYHNYEIFPLLNDVPDIFPEVFINHNTRPKTMCNIIGVS
jgi:hypothetical protein